MMTRTPSRPRSLSRSGRAGAPKPEKPFLTPGRALMLVGFSIGTALAILYLSLTWQHFYWLNAVSEAETQLQILKNERELLRLDVSQAFSLQRIERIARRDLRMVRPEIGHSSLKFLNLISR